MKNEPRKIYNAFRKSMLDKSDDWKTLLASKVTLTGPLAQVEGKAAFIEVNTPFFSSIVDSQLRQVIEKDNYILTQIVTKVMTPNGEYLTLEVAEWYEIRDNLIQSLQVYFDTAAFRAAMGIPLE